MLNAQTVGASCSQQSFTCTQRNKAAAFNPSSPRYEYLIRRSCVLLLRASSLRLESAAGERRGREGGRDGGGA